MLSDSSCALACHAPQVLPHVASGAGAAAALCQQHHAEASGQFVAPWVLQRVLHVLAEAQDADIEVNLETEPSSSLNLPVAASGAGDAPGAAAAGVAAAPWAAAGRGLSSDEAALLRTRRRQMQGRVVQKLMYSHDEGTYSARLAAG